MSLAYKSYVLSDDKRSWVELINEGVESKATKEELNQVTSDVVDLSDNVTAVVGRLDSYEQSITQAESKVAEHEDTLSLLSSTEETTGSIKQIAKSYTDELDNTLSPVAKSGKASSVSIDNGNFKTATVEGAISELYDSVNDLSTSSVVTLTTAFTPDDNDSATYIFVQGETEIGRIHIGKDLVATKGELVSEDGSGNSGTFIKMTVANGTPFYIPVDELIGVYSGSGDVETITNGIEIKVTDGIISATVKTIDGAKINDGTVTFAKLAEGVQDKINSIDTVKSELLGNAVTDTVESKTIEGLIKKTNMTSNTLANLDTYVGSIPNESNATSVIEYINTIKHEIDNINQYLVWHRFDEA